MTARLVVSLSGLTDRPEALEPAADLATALDGRGVALTQLFRPHAAPDEVVAWLRGRLDGGDALALHGYDHTPEPTGARTGLGRRAEFAALPRHEASLRLIAARRGLTALGLRTDTFVPPRWLASPGTVDALREQGFAACADEVSVRLLGSPDTVLAARVLGFRASGELRAVAEDRRAAEAWRARRLAAEVARGVAGGGLVRLAVRAKDLRRPARVAAVLAAVDAALAAGARPSTYRALVTAARAA
ncbi:MAG: DUF2334 domain-containing protein [Pseudonocardia sp.]